MHLGFVGAGNMAGAILTGVLGRGLIPADHIWISNRSGDKLAPFAAQGVHTTTDNKEVARACDVVILAVKPQVFDDVLPELASELAGKCAVSIAAGLSVSYLKGQLPGVQVIRVMPNTPLGVGLGATAIADAPEVDEALFQAVTDIFAAAGEVAVIPESQMDDIIAVSGSSPAFFFRMAGALVAEAKKNGIDPELALRMAAKTMEGSARMLLESGKSPEELTGQVCSPGGTTLAALSAFDEWDFEGMIAQATARCGTRSRELGK